MSEHIPFGCAVWKFPLRIDDVTEIKMPRGARVLHFALQTDPRIDDDEGQPFVWALCDTDPLAPKVTRVFRLAGTGHPLGVYTASYVGTVHLNNGQLVFHLFDCGEKP